ncbi:hypothetical protein ACVWW4_006594 [Bradyrhizobium sp. LB7.1]
MLLACWRPYPRPFPPSSYNPDNWLQHVGDFGGVTGSGANTYHVVSSDQSGVSSAGYSGGGTGSISGGADVVPGDTSSTLVIGATGQAVASAIEKGGDKDYFKVYFVSGDTYEISVQGSANHGYPALADSFFRIRDTQNHVLASPADHVGGDQLDFVAPYTGWYYVSVGAGGPNFTTLAGALQSRRCLGKCACRKSRTGGSR